MRRQLGIGLVALSLAATGCAPKSTSTDAEHTVAHWASPSATGKPVPRVGQCYTVSPSNNRDMAHFGPADCTVTHYLETAYVGQLAGAVAQLAAAPVRGGRELADANSRCNTAATAYVGGPLVDQQLVYLVTVPSNREWSDGARWYTCDLGLVSPYSIPSYFPQSSSVRGVGSTPSRPLCFNLAEKDTTDGMTGAACDSPHSVEFVGALQAPFGAVYPATDTTWARYQTLCRDRIASLMGVSQATVIRKWGYVLYRPDEGLWRDGMRITQCYFVLWNAKTITKSIRGSQGAGIPESW